MKRTTPSMPRPVAPIPLFEKIAFPVLIVLAALAFLLAGLAAGCTTAEKSYVEADKATFDVISPEYAEYIRKDGGLTEEQKARRLALVKSWGLRVEAASAKETAK